MLNNIRLL